MSDPVVADALPVPFSGAQADLCGYVGLAGDMARDWIESHQWPARQQAVIDRERGEGT